MSGPASRAAAARIVDAVLSKGRSLDAVLADADAGDDAFVRMLAYGTLRQHFRLASRLSDYLERPLRRRDAVVTALLEIGLFQIEASRVPDHAAVSATVEAVRVLGRPKLAGLVNAILRRALRESWTPRSVSARLNHPDWIIERLHEDWPDDADGMLGANDERAPMWLRINRRRTTLEAFSSLLDEAGLAYSYHAALPDALRLEAPVPVSELPGFEDGLVSVQDGGAQLAASWLLDGLPASRLLDACAAPGGKSAHLLELAGSGAALTCIDIDAERATAIERNLERLGLAATVRAADASLPDSWWDGQPYDAILLDAPCSASGVIRRHPDIKLNRRASDIDALTAVQVRLLESLWPLLAPGGRLLYVTCSVFRDENERIVAPFVDRHSDAREVLLQNNNISALMRRQACGYQLLPGTAAMDGFYFACLLKAD